MNADSAFVIGSTHAICQDYVLAGNPASVTASPYVICPTAVPLHLIRISARGCW